MASKTSNYPVAFYFELSFKGEDAAFQEVTGLSKELSIEEVVCGGENRFKYRLPGIATSQNLVLKRAVVAEGSKLIDWCAASIDGGLTLKIQPHDVTVSLLDGSGMVSVMWTFYNAYPVKYSVSDLKSQDNNLAIETIELAYTYFEVANDTMFGNLFNS